MSATQELACRLIGKELTERKAVIAAELMDHVERVSELLGGFELQWSGSCPWAERVFEFVSLERQCCPFIRFEIAVEPNDGPVELRLLGNNDVKQFIRGELLSSLPNPTPKA